MDLGSPPRPLHGFLRLLISWELEGMLVGVTDQRGLFAKPEV